MSLGSYIQRIEYRGPRERIQLACPLGPKNCRRQSEQKRLYPSHGVRCLLNVKGGCMSFCTSSGWLSLSASALALRAYGDSPGKKDG